jgi:hypothetical protein
MATLALRDTTLDARRVWLPLAYIGVAGVLVATSFSNDNMIPRVRIWREQVDELAVIGRWFNATLANGTVISTFANGVLSYEAGSKLVVIDQLGLTDEHIARHGRRLDRAPAGHASRDDLYVVLRRPAVAIFSGSGFAAAPSCTVRPPWRRRYDGVSFQVSGKRQFVNVVLRRDRRDQLVADLTRDQQFRLVECPGARGR